MSLYSETHGHDSCMSDIKELNEAKVANILAYLEHTCVHDHNARAEYIGKDRENIRNSVDARSIDLSEKMEERHSEKQMIDNKNICTSRTSVRNEEKNSITGVVENGGSGAVDAGIKSRSLLSSNLQSVNNGLLQVHSTYSAIKDKIENLEHENRKLREKNQELTQQIKEWQTEELEREARMKYRYSTEMESLRAEVKRKTHKIVLELTQSKEETKLLQEKVLQLQEELSSTIAKSKEERQKIESANTSALSQLKARWQAQEKTSREKWKLAEAKRIKETTLQSLEPDIVLLLNRHKAEKARLREEYENELRIRDQITSNKEAAMEELKNKIAKDAEVARAREQSMFETRLREEVDLLRREQDEERRMQRCKLTQLEQFYEGQQNLLTSEISKLNQELLKVKSEYSAIQASFHEEVAREVTRVTSESNEVVQNIKKKMESELVLREKSAEVENMKKLRELESEIRRRCEHERDAAIAKAVDNLEKEHHEALSSSRHNNGILRDRYQQLNRDNERLRVEVELAKEQLQHAHNTLCEREKQMNEWKVRCDAVDEVVNVAIKSNTLEWQRKINVMELDWQKKISDLERENAINVNSVKEQLDLTLNELEIARRQLEIAQQTSEQRHHAELEQINERVLVTMTQKDNTIHMQSEQIAALREAITIRDYELEKHHKLIS